MSSDDIGQLQEHFAARRYADALARAKQIVQSPPDAPESLEILVETLSRLGAWQEIDSLLPHLSRAIPGSRTFHFASGYVSLQKGVLAAAEDQLERAIVIDPSHEPSQEQLARTLYRLMKYDRVLEIGAALLARTANPLEALLIRGFTFGRLGRLEEALDSAQKAVALAPNHEIALTLLGDALVDLRRFKEADEVLKKAAALNRGLAAKVRASMYLLQGDFARGWDEYALSVRYQPEFVRNDIQARPWNGEPIKDKTILIYEEQGFGDFIQFIRYATLLANQGATVFAEVRPTLKSLARRVKGVDWVVPRGSPWPPCDYCVSVMQLPRLLKARLNNIPGKVPYMTAAPQWVDRWRDKVNNDPPGLRVGLSWRGSPTQANNLRRSIATGEWLALKDLPGVTFYNLQRDLSADERSLICDGLKMVDHTPGLADFSDTAALMMNLDLIVSVCTSVAHLAGALGRPTLVLLNRAAEWRWLVDREDSPWYPTMQLIRQDGRGWPAVIERVKQELLRKTNAT